MYDDKSCKIPCENDTYYEFIQGFPDTKVNPPLNYTLTTAEVNRGKIQPGGNTQLYQNAPSRMFDFKAPEDDVAKCISENTERFNEEINYDIDGKIRVNAIAPGFFISKQNKKLLIKENGKLTERAEKIIAKTPMGRFGKPEELSEAVKFLCGDGASFITGIVLPIDGGFSSFSGV